MFIGQCVANMCTYLARDSGCRAFLERHTTFDYIKHQNDTFLHSIEPKRLLQLQNFMPCMYCAKYLYYWTPFAQAVGEHMSKYASWSPKEELRNKRCKAFFDTRASPVAFKIVRRACANNCAPLPPCLSPLHQSDDVEPPSATLSSSFESNSRARNKTAPLKHRCSEKLLLAHVMQLIKPDKMH